MTEDPPRTWGQQEALDQLRQIAAVNGTVRVLREHQQSGYLHVTVSIDCSDLVPNGSIRLEKRERFLITVPPRFPFVAPQVFTHHTRWADNPHIYWGRLICLFISPSVEWDPSDGMTGFVERLVLWLERAAAGTLDPAGQPLHPPFASPTAEAGLVVVRANPPSVQSDAAWLGYALLRQMNPGRYDLVDWLELDQARPLTPNQVRHAVDDEHTDTSLVVAPAVLLPRPITSEYPQVAEKVLVILAEQGVEREAVFTLLESVIKTNRLLSGQRGNRNARLRPSLHVVIGTPSLGIAGSSERQTHLVVWQVPSSAELAAAGTLRRSTGRHRRNDATPVIDRKWLAAAPAEWTRVLDARPDIVIRRDNATSASWLAGKRVMVLGTGALGAPIAQACVRGGVRKIVLVDHNYVNPGVLVRQPYGDEDIGIPKVDALAQQLQGIAPSVEIETHQDNIVTTMFGDETPPPAVNLIIDATADRAVRALLERNRALHRESWPATATVLVGHQATHGLATIARPGASGGALDILRRLGIQLGVQTNTALQDAAVDFFPDPPRTTFFQPEPGCSDVTFVGSMSDVTGLAGQLFAGVLSALNNDEPTETMHALLVHMPSFPDNRSGAGPTWFHWPNDTLVRTDDDQYEIRLAPAAIAEMRAEARRGRRLRTPRVETGGSLLGRVDTALGILWIDEATPPPSDSQMSEVYFKHGMEGVAEHIAARSAATARATSFVGMWHTHPYGDTVPSPLDTAGMARLVTPTLNTPPRASMLILGGRQRWDDWLDHGTWPESYATIVEADRVQQTQDEPSLPELPPGMRWWSARRADQVVERPRRRRWRLPRWWPRRRSCPR